jgi:hypothetical protein|tara:strand:- start:146 stop:727 length:582 start_codon:yes stop_codon:yes gene_type:complete
MDIMANYYSVKDRVKSVFTKAVPSSLDGVRTLDEKISLLLRSNRRIKTDLGYLESHINNNHAFTEDKVDTLVTEISHLKQQVMSMSNSGMNETGEVVLTQDVPTPTFEEKFYNNYEQIIDRLKGDIIAGIRSHSLDSFRTIEKDRVYFYVKAACDNLDAEITQILVGREEQLADEYASQFEFVEEDNPNESKM